jgi:hypothetical protein
MSYVDPVGATHMHFALVDERVDLLGERATVALNLLGPDGGANVVPSVEQATAQGKIGQ